MREHPLPEALATARIVMARRNVELTEEYADAVRDFYRSVAASRV